MSSHNVWREVSNVAAELTIPDPFDLQAFVDAASAARRKPIELIPLDTEQTTPCGLLAATDRADYIFYAANTSGLHVEHIVVHEIAHLLMGHQGTTPLAMDTTVLNLLMPSLPTEVIRRVLGRTVYAEAEEQQAELLASLVLHRTRQAITSRPPAPADMTETVARLSDIFGTGRRHHDHR